jgi:pimeloyl-ACP methyl ester carboxylesterase
VSVNFHRAGSGPPLVLLHGIGLHWQSWRPVIDRLTYSFDVIACDSPGFGRSAPLPADVEPTIPAYAEAFGEFFRELSLARPHVAGNSMGGAIALELARAHKVASASAFSPAGFWSPAERRFCQLSLGLAAGIPRPLRPAVRALAATRAGRVALFKQTFGWPTRIPAAEAVAMFDDAWAAPAFAGALAAFDHYEFSAGEQLGATPVTIAWGRYDRLLIYVRQAQRARARLPLARHVTLGAGHVPFFDDPAAVAESIRVTAGAGKTEPTGRATRQATDATLLEQFVSPAATLP